MASAMQKPVYAEELERKLAPRRGVVLRLSNARIASFLNVRAATLGSVREIVGLTRFARRYVAENSGGRADKHHDHLVPHRTSEASKPMAA